MYNTSLELWRLGRGRSVQYIPGAVEVRYVVEVYSTSMELWRLGRGRSVH